MQVLFYKYLRSAIYDSNFFSEKWVRICTLVGLHHINYFTVFRLEVLLSKKSPGDWKTVVEGDDRGKFVLDGQQISALEDLAKVGHLHYVVNQCPVEELFYTMYIFFMLFDLFTWIII